MKGKSVKMLKMKEARLEKKGGVKTKQEKTLEKVISKKTGKKYIGKR